MRRGICFVFLFLGAIAASAAVTRYELYPNIHTIGIMVISNTPLSETTATQVYYEEYQNGSWGAIKQGLELSRVTALQYSGCIFWTQPNTLYRVRTVITDGTIIMDSTQTIITRPEPEAKAPLRVFYVSPAGSGISQDAQAPGSLSQPLLDHLIAGDKVILLPGVYYTGELEIKTAGTAQHPIVFEGDSAILDGSIPDAIQWTRVNTDTAHRDYNMFYATLGTLNTNCVIADDKRMYPYRNLLELSLFQTIRAIDGNGFASGNFNIGLSGFFRDGRNPSANHFPYVGYNANTYIKFADGSDTTGKSIKISKQSSAFRAAGKSNIQFVNIQFRYFGAAKLSNHRCAILLNDCDSILVDSCNFQFCDRGVVFTGDADDNVVQRCSFFDDIGNWNYLQFKETNEDYAQLNSYYPNYFPYNYRNVEPGRVYFDRNFTGRGNIVRYNTFDGGCDGITCPPTPGDSTTSRHFDIYENEFMNSADDAFEVDGNASNVRVWGNRVHHSGGISVASPCYGPVYIFRNVIYDLPESNYEYIYFDIAGYHLHSEPVKASPLKLNAAYCDIPGVVYFMHNTCDVGITGRGFYLQQPQPQSSWANVIARNNIFYVESNDFALWVRALDKVDLDYNAYYSTQGFTARQDRNGLGVYYSLAEVAQNILGEIIDSTSFIETHGYELDPSPGWKNEAAHDYHLLPVSSMIDKGVHIPGVNDDYCETAPDLGAFELIVQRDTSLSFNTIASIDTAYSKDTVEIIQPGINDTVIHSASSTACDSNLIRGTPITETDSFFADTLFITTSLVLTDSLFIHCEALVTDSVFIPDSTTNIKREWIHAVVYPNPNTGTFSISYPNNYHAIEVTLFDLAGRQIPCIVTGRESGVFVIAEQPPAGIYQLHLQSRDYYIRKLITVVP